MVKLYFVLLITALFFAGCKKENPPKQPPISDKELVQAMLVGGYNMNCITYTWLLGYPNSDSTHYSDVWIIDKAIDSTNILVNDTLMTSFELYRYHEVGGVTSRTLVLTFFEPDSIYAHRKLGGGLGGGTNVQCQGKKL